MKVISGIYERDTGLVVRVEDNVVILISDITMHEVSVKFLFCNVLHIQLQHENAFTCYQFTFDST